jgi:hypothetical protein
MSLGERFMPARSESATARTEQYFWDRERDVQMP